MEDNLSYFAGPTIYSLLVKVIFLVQGLIAMCLNIVTADDSGLSSSTSSSVHSVAYSKQDGGVGWALRPYAPLTFMAAVVKLTALQIHILGVRYDELASV